MNKKCKYCGYEGALICEGFGPYMGCNMPGLTDKEPDEAKKDTEPTAQIKEKG